MPLAYPGNSYSKICLNNLSFGVDAARIAEPILSSLKEQLTDVYLSEFTAGRPISEAIQVMEIFSLALEGCNLKTLSLSHNSLGEKGVRAFGALLKCQSNKEELYLVNAGITKEAATAVSELIPCTEKLKVLHFDFNRIGDEGAISIAKVVQGSPSLEDFRCATSWIGPKGGKLDLMDNMFGKEAAIPLTRVLSSNAGLTEIYLGCLGLGREGVITVVNALRECAPSTASALAAEQSLTKLILSGNRLKDQGTILIAGAHADGHNRLRGVDVSSNAITQDGATVLARAVAHKPEFTLLKINGNCISEEGITEVKVIFGESMLGPLDENDPNGEDDWWDEDVPDGEADEQGKLGLTLKNLKVSD
ncbi:hypothetical protein MKW94_013231 [Papaver nudicaule]|uniref:Uncharacterized protein n=1 Tax=Papaver nudicaule TaxID=74823 RepID=A0AA42AXE8_PAPNU|nr:hypothetical protein [Papaver nudicaule]